MSNNPKFRFQHFTVVFGASSDVYDQTIQEVMSIGVGGRAFVVIDNVCQSSAGKNTPDTQDLDNDDITVKAELTSLTNVRLTRSSSGINQDIRVSFTVWEYRGPAGGPDEWIVRGAGDVSLSKSDKTGTLSLSGVLNSNNVVPFCSGYVDSSNKENFKRCQPNIRLLNSNLLQVERNKSNSSVTYHVSAVEFVGTNWTIQKDVNFSLNNGDQGNNIIRTINDVGDWNKTFIIANMSPGHKKNAHIGFNIWPGPNTTSYYLRMNEDAKGEELPNTIFNVYIVTNPSINVEHRNSITGTDDQIDGSESSKIYSVTPIEQNLGNDLVAYVGYSDSFSGEKTSYPIPQKNYSMPSTNSFEFYRGSTDINNGDGDVSFQIIKFEYDLYTNLQTKNIKVTPINPIVQVQSTTFITTVGISSSEQFGSNQLNLHFRINSGIASNEIVSNPIIIYLIKTQGIPTAEQFGPFIINPGTVTIFITGPPESEEFVSNNSKLNLILFQGTIQSEESFGNLELDVEVKASEIPSNEAFGNLKIKLHLKTISILSEESFGIDKLNLSIIPFDIPSQEIFETPIILVGETFLQPNSILSNEQFGSHQINQNIITNSINSEEAFGQFNIRYIISTQEIPSKETFGSHQINQNIITNSINSEEAFGQFNIITGTVFVQMQEGIQSEESFGDVKVLYIIEPLSIQSEESLGNFELDQDLNVGQIPSLEIVNSVQVNLTIKSNSINSEEIFGNFKLIKKINNINGIDSEEVVNSVSIEYVIHSINITSKESFGLSHIKHEISISAGIPSEEFFGTINFNFNSFISNAGSIDSKESFGLHQINTTIFPVGAIDQAFVNIPKIIKNIKPVSISSESFVPNLVLTYKIKIPSISSEELISNNHIILPGNVDILPSSINSEEAFGSYNISQIIELTNIVSEETFGSFDLDQEIDSSQIFSQEVVNPVVVLPGNVNILPSSINSEESFGSHSINNVIQPTEIISLSDFGVAKINSTIFTTHISTNEIFGPVEIITIISNIGINSEEAFGSHQINQNIITNSINSEEAFGLHNVSINMDIIFSGINSEEEFGSHNIIYIINYDGIISEEIVNSLIIKTFNLIIAQGIISEETLGTHSIINIINPTSIISEEAFGNNKLNLEILPLSIKTEVKINQVNIIFDINPESIASLEQIGTHEVIHELEDFSIPSEEAFGNPIIIIEQFINISSLQTEESFGIHKFNYEIELISINSNEVFGNNSILPEIDSFSIPSEEAFGNHNILVGPVFILPNGIFDSDIGNFNIIQIIDTSSIQSTEIIGTITINPEVDSFTIPSGEKFGEPLIILYLLPFEITSSENVSLINAIQIIKPSSIPSEEIFGVIFDIENETELIGIPSSEIVGTPRIKKTIHLNPGLGISSEETFGVPTQIDFKIFLNGFQEEEIGSLNVIPGPITIDLVEILSKEIFGEHLFKYDISLISISSQETFINNHLLSLSIELNSIQSKEFFGVHNLIENISNVGIPSEEIFGSLKIKLDITLISINTDENIGSHLIIPTTFSLITINFGIPPEETFGNIKINQFIEITEGIESQESFFASCGVFSGIFSEEIFGRPKINYHIILETFGIPSEEAIGDYILSEKVIYPTSINSEESFGNTWVADHTLKAHFVSIVTKRKYKYNIREFR